MMTQRERHKWEVKADAAWSNAVRKRDKLTCQYCGKFHSDVNPVEAHHIFTRHRKSVRHDLKNGVAVCKHCHDNEVSGEAFKLWLIERMGEILWGELVTQANKPAHDYDPKANYRSLR